MSIQEFLDNYKFYIESIDIDKKSGRFTVKFIHPSTHTHQEMWDDLQKVFMKQI